MVEAWCAMNRDKGVRSGYEHKRVSRWAGKRNHQDIQEPSRLRLWCEKRTRQQWPERACLIVSLRLDHRPWRKDGLSWQQGGGMTSRATLNEGRAPENYWTGHG